MLELRPTFSMPALKEYQAASPLRCNTTGSRAPVFSFFKVQDGNRVAVFGMEVVEAIARISRYGWSRSRSLAELNSRIARFAQTWWQRAGGAVRFPS